jgi:hypothetical protein
MYTCVICDRIFTEIPEDALEITGGRGYRSRHPALFRFSDGTVHALRKVPVKKQQPQAPAPEPKEDTDLLQATLSVLAELPTPPVEIKTQPLPLIEPDIEGDESQPMSTMQLAFRRIQEK